MTRTILVTGGAGFIGAHLARALAARGAHIRVLDDLSIGRLEYVASLPIELIRASLTDGAAIHGALRGAEAIVHLAARAGVPESIEDPAGTFDVNVSQTLELLEAARRADIERFVFASSNAVLGSHEPPADEHVVPRPSSPYGASKLAGEALCQAYSASYGICTSALRFSNAYGEYSLHKQSVVAAWLRAAADGRPVTIHGDGEQTRDFVHAADLASAIVAVLEAPRERVGGEVFQVGSGVETTVNALAEVFVGAWARNPGRGTGEGRTRPEVVRGTSRPGDVRRNVARIDKARAELGYEPRIQLREGLERTVRWFRTAVADSTLAAIRPHTASGSE